MTDPTTEEHLNQQLAPLAAWGVVPAVKNEDDAPVHRASPAVLSATVAPDVAAGAGGNDVGVLRLDNTKAGMGSVDKAHVEAVINEMSRGSPFYINEQRKAAARRKKAAAMRDASAQFDKLPVAHRRGVHDAVGRAVARLEANRTFGVFLHLDMDMFFAAVEEKRNPALKDVPFGVGGLGMLSTTNYLARAYGVRAGMPGYIGRKLCPQLVFAFSSFDAYRSESEVVRGILKEYDPHFHSGGLDEFTLNLRPYLEAAAADDVQRSTAVDGAAGVVDANRGGDRNDEDATTTDEARILQLLDGAARVAEEIRERIRMRTQLTASCGIASTPCLAKIVGNFNKPNGQYQLRVASRDGVLAFVGPLSVRSIPGIGKAMEEVLQHAFGITTCAELLEQRERLYHCWTPKTFEFLLEIGLGVMGSFGGFPSDDNKADTGAGSGGGDGAGNKRDRSVVGEDDLAIEQPVAADPSSGASAALRRKSIGHERTFRPKLLPQELIDVAETNLKRSHETLLQEGLLTRQVGLKLKYKSFEVKQSTAALSLPTDNVAVLQEAMMLLLSPHLHEHTEFRLLGVRLADLSVRQGGSDCTSVQLPPAISILVQQQTGTKGSGGTPMKQPPLHGGHKTLDAFLSMPRAPPPSIREPAHDDVVHLTTPPMHPCRQRNATFITCISDDDDDDDDVVVEQAPPPSSNRQQQQQQQQHVSSQLPAFVTSSGGGSKTAAYDGDDCVDCVPSDGDDDDAVVCVDPQASVHHQPLSHCSTRHRAPPTTQVLMGVRSDSDCAATATRSSSGSVVIIS